MVGKMARSREKVWYPSFLPSIWELIVGGGVRIEVYGMHEYTHSTDLSSALED